MLPHALRVVADAVLAHGAGEHAWGDGDVVGGRPLHRFLRAGYGNPDRRMWLLHWPWPDRHILVVVVLPLERETLFHPRAADYLEGFLEAPAAFRHGYVEYLVFAWRAS